MISDPGSLHEPQGLREKCEETRGMVEKIRLILEKADARKLQEPENRRHWDQVIDQLERSLLEMRGRLEHLEYQLTTLDQGVHAASNGIPTTTADSSGAPTLVLSVNPEEALRKVLALSLEELSSLTMEQVGLLHAQLPQYAEALDKDGAERAEARIELANQLRPQRTESPEEARKPVSHFMERRRQFLLRAALDKVRAGRLPDITREEKTLIASCHEMLSRRVMPDERDKRLLRMLQEAVDVLGLRAPTT